ncbi:hypothetical protein EEB12_01120 [Rhodococcus sp. WS1]|uniref:hypothetical protein n=1 Tax=unclassified Rhodococcus (in: high G+C Gram-positive bacteria) TaxID=192944 RepID=UPI0011450945|nr:MULTISPECIES: hypothetical protein [unclassified Rhodococcus (in: high G+C Gram-positive bacteria)]ROZ58661.1 hypothetical protein EEB12_01120 [Rhodococcus sp. WS1]TQC38604.1 hypothetical protein EEB16_10350 [Rhodococcus sp. WS7]
MSSGAPWWAFIVTAGVAFISACVSGFSLWYNIKRTDERELEKWKRDVIMKSTSDFISTSGLLQEFKILNMGAWTGKHTIGSAEKHEKLRRESYQFSIIGSEELMNAAKAIIELHNRFSTDNISKDNFIVKTMDYKMIEIAHEDLIEIAKQLTSKKRSKKYRLFRKNFENTSLPISQEYLETFPSTLNK